MSYRLCISLPFRSPLITHILKQKRSSYTWSVATTNYLKKLQYLNNIDKTNGFSMWRYQFKMFTDSWKTNCCQVRYSSNNISAWNQDVKICQYSELKTHIMSFMWLAFAYNESNMNGDNDQIGFFNGMLSNSKSMPIHLKTISGDDKNTIIAY